MLVVAAGRPGPTRSEHIREGAVVLDVRTNPVHDVDTGAIRMVVDFDTVASRSRAITPVPGGVGPVTDVWLLRNTVAAAGNVDKATTSEQADHTTSTRPSDYVLTFSCMDQLGSCSPCQGSWWSTSATSWRASSSPTAGYAGSSCGCSSNRRMSTRWICRRCARISVRRRISSAWRGGLLAAAQKQRVLVLVSKFGHCLNDLLFRTANGALNIKIAAVVSNHAS